MSVYETGTILVEYVDFVLYIRGVLRDDYSVSCQACCVSPSGGIRAVSIGMDISYELRDHS